MIRMKKLFASLSILLLAILPGKAQVVNFRVEAGAAFNLGKMAIAGYKLDNKTRTGYHFGAYVDLPVYNNLYVGSGLTFAMKGTSFTEETDKDVEQSNITLHYLQIPVNLGYKFQVSPQVALALQTGPYFAVALGGTAKTGLKGAKESYNLFKDGVTNLAKPNRFDMGWGLDVRAMYSRYYLFAGADFGFLEVFKDNSNDSNSGIGGIVNSLKPSFKNTLIHVGLGVSF